MSDTDDRISRAAALPPPTIAEVILLHLFAELVSEKPKRLERVCARARDHAENAKVIALHGATNDPAWDAAFRDAEIRLDSVAAMIRRTVPLAAKKPKHRKRR